MVPSSNAVHHFRSIAIALARDQRTDRRIKAREVRLVGPGGEQLGVVPTEQALQKAQELGLNLVEVNPMLKPPVCKIMDYGRFKYEEKKKTNDAKKKQIVVKIKEIKLRPKTEEHDYETKIRHAREFLEEGNKAKITIMFRGREMTHRELGTAVLDDVVNDLKDIAVTEQTARLEGKTLFMILGPNAKTAQRARDGHRASLAALEKEKAKSKGPNESAPNGKEHSKEAAPDSTIAAPAIDSSEIAAAAVTPAVKS
jgi:translation initiation factor IF-3